ncbi:MAG: hypothetical protein ACFFDW_05985, partial [Candidatus Thorarchaeota archaeon]
GECNHNYTTTMFHGRVSFVTDFNEKKEVLLQMICKLDNSHEDVIKEQITEKAITNVTVGRIDIDYMSGKKAK